MTHACRNSTQIAKFLGPTWGLPWSCRFQMGPMLAPLTLLLGYPYIVYDALYVRISITLWTNLDPLARSCHPWKHGSWGQHGAKLGLTGPRWAPCWPHKPCCLGYWDVTTINFSQLTHWGRDKMTAIFQTTFSNCIFLNENVWISIKISLKFVPNGPINIIPALFQIMA